MKRLGFRAGLCLMLLMCLLCGSAAAYNITDSTVQNTNVYAGSSVSTFGPDGTYDAESCTSSDITNDANVYIRPVDLTADITNSVNVLLSVVTQGAMVDIVDGEVVQTSYSWNFGTGQKEETNTPSVLHTYPAGDYTASISVSNYLDEGGESKSIDLSILYGGYDSYQTDWISILSLIIVAALIAVVAIIIVFIRVGGDLNILIPLSAGMLVLIVVLMMVVSVGGLFSEATMHAFS